MSTKYLIGIDGGSQSSKVAIYNLEGRLICAGRQGLRPMSMPKPGIVEHPEDDLWESLVVASREAMRRFTGDPADILGVGLCSIRFCRAVLAQDGSLASPVMSWMDTRSSSPYQHDDPHARYVTTSTGYLTHRLTGSFRDAAGNYQGQWPIDTDNWQWSASPEVFLAHGVPREMLFDLSLPGEVLGQITPQAAAETGLPAGLPVVATANDKATEALGAGLQTQDKALVSLGTYIAAMVPAAHGDPTDPRPAAEHWTNFACVPREYLYESHGIRRGMWAVTWLLEMFGGNPQDATAQDAEGLLNQEAASVPPGSEGLMTVPEFLATPDAPYKKGVMIGFDARHTRAHLYRSALEAIALTMGNNIAAMLSEVDLDVTGLVISGGGADSDVLMQIFADVLDLPASRNVVTGSVSLGSAICVAVAAGAYPDFAVAVENMVQVGRTFHPKPRNVALYRAMNEVYTTITTHTDEVLKRSYPLFH